MEDTRASGTQQREMIFSGPDGDNMGDSMEVHVTSGETKCSVKIERNRRIKHGLTGNTLCVSMDGSTVPFSMGYLLMGCLQRRGVEGLCISVALLAEPNELELLAILIDILNRLTGMRFAATTVDEQVIIQEKGENIGQSFT